MTALFQVVSGATTVDGVMGYGGRLMTFHRHPQSWPGGSSADDPLRPWAWFREGIAPNIDAPTVPFEWRVLHPLNEEAHAMLAERVLTNQGG